VLSLLDAFEIIFRAPCDRVFTGLVIRKIRREKRRCCRWVSCTGVMLADAAVELSACRRSVMGADDVWRGGMAVRKEKVAFRAFAPRAGRVSEARNQKWCLLAAGIVRFRQIDPISGSRPDDEFATFRRCRCQRKFQPAPPPLKRDESKLGPGPNRN